MTHTTAADHLAYLGLPEDEAMNAWQDFGRVSDCAVHLRDVAPCDLGSALEWLYRVCGEKHYDGLLPGAPDPRIKRKGMVVVDTQQEMGF